MQDSPKANIYRVTPHIIICTGKEQTFSQGRQISINWEFASFFKNRSDLATGSQSTQPKLETKSSPPSGKEPKRRHRRNDSHLCCHSQKFSKAEGQHVMLCFLSSASFYNYQQSPGDHFQLREISFKFFTAPNQLSTLADDDCFEITIEDFIVSSKSPFSILLEDNQSFGKWDEFVSSSEEKQQELIDTKKKKKNDCKKQPSINKALRSLLRKKSLPLGLLQYLEQELITFFSAQPTQIYISPALSSFERLLLHCVSNYHRLASLSFVAEPENVKLVRIKNPRNEFTSPPLLLVQYLESTYRLH